MNTINQVREKIVSELKSAFRNAGKDPYVISTSYPASEAANDAHLKEAKAKADNGVVYVGRLPRAYGEKKGGVYSVTDPYQVLIYTNNRGDDVEINDLYDIARDCLYKFMDLITDYVCDVRDTKSGMYMAFINCKCKPTIYAG